MDRRKGRLTLDKQVLTCYNILILDKREETGMKRKEDTAQVIGGVEVALLIPVLFFAIAALLLLGRSSGI